MGESSENYLETILVIEKRSGTVRSVDVARELGFSKPSVSVAMKNLRSEGLIAIDAKGNISLTKAGEAAAASVYERHTVISRALIAMGVSKATAGEDACRIEHVISEETFSRFKEFFGEKI